jgi:hypothetical protein
MRLIDADKLHPDRMTNRGTVAISQSQIANAPAVPAIPISVIEGIRAEIKKWDKEPACYILSYDANKRFNELINEHIKEYVNDKRRS